MNWQIASFTLLAIALAGGFAWYERSRPPAKVLALVAALAALAVIGRIAFAPFPNVKPVTDIVLLSGYALGGAPGFAIGAVTALVSNFFFLQGPWTPWQMAAWGGVGIAGACLARAARGRELGRWSLALACAAAGAAFGLVMDLYQWTLAAEQTLASYVAVSGSSLPYNLAHVIGNAAFCLVIGPPLVRALRRYRERFEVRWEPRPATAAAPAGPALGAIAALAVAASLLASLAAPGVAAAATAEGDRAAGYLARAQNDDGGFGRGPGDSSNQSMTAWAGLGLAAAGRNPLDVARKGRSVVEYTRRNAGSIDDTGDLSRTILLLEAAGVSPRGFSGSDLVDRLRAKRNRNGSYDGLVNQTAFAILALRASGAGNVRDSARWIAEKQNGDGGFGFDPELGSDVDVTGAALQALAAAGQRGGKPVKRAIDYLERAQRGDGGFGQRKGSSSNAQSTAWAVQGLVAAGRNPESFRSGGTPLGYLRRLQRSDGSVSYSRSSGQTPVWVTGQALLALERKAFPLRAVARERGGGGGAGGSGSAGGAAAGDGAGGGAGRIGAGSEDRASVRPGREAGASAAGSAAPGEVGSLGAVASQGAGAPAPEAEASIPRSSGGSAVGGIAAAAASAAFVIGVRRRLRKRLGRAEGVRSSGE